MPENTLYDEEFGEIVIRRSPLARHVRMSIAPDGRLRASLPSYAPLLLVKRMLKRSRQAVRHLIAQHQPTSYYDGMPLGKSHRLIVMQTQRTLSRIERLEQNVVLHLATDDELRMTHIVTLIRSEHKRVLQKEAKAYLPRRLAYFADIIGVQYQSVRFSHASGRWGSCSSSGTISLNIALMKLPHELIDYVLVHELCHVREMNHSQTFWRLVAEVDPNYKEHRKQIRAHQPHLV